MVAPRYQFLQKLHALLQPRGYLEIGVQHGGSLALAQCPALGIDPAPLVIPGTVGPQAQVMVATSDHYFENVNQLMPTYVDLAFIDGMHLAEFALRDFINVERHMQRDGVIVFDDVLPYSWAIATRTQPAGDWTGDVWKIIEVLKLHRLDLRMLQVNSQPTGALVVFNVDPTNRRLAEAYSGIYPGLLRDEIPPGWVIGRTESVSEDDALECLRLWKETER